MQQQPEQSETQNEQLNQQEKGEMKTPNSSQNNDKAEKAGRVAHLAALLNETPTGEEEKDGEETQDPTKKEGEKGDVKKEKEKGASKTDIKTFGDLAKAVGVDKAKLYDIQVTLKDQKTNVSIGQLKDAYQDQEDITFREIEWGERRAKEEQEMSRARSELEVLVSLVPKESLKPEQVKAASKIVQAQLDRAKADLIRRVPEWEDAEVMKSEGTKINEYLADYGIKLASIRDPAVIHYIRNAWKQDTRIKAALEKIRKTETNTPSPSGKSDTRSRQTRGRQTSERAREISRHFMGQDQE